MNISHGQRTLLPQRTISSSLKHTSNAVKVGRGFDYGNTLIRQIQALIMLISDKICGCNGNTLMARYIFLPKPSLWKLQLW